MPTTVGVRRRRQRAKMGIDLPGNNNRNLEIARDLRRAIDAPVLGGIAVFLLGGGRGAGFGAIRAGGPSF